MDRICVITDTEARAVDLRARLAGYFEARFFPLTALPDSAPEEFTLVDVDLRDPNYCAGLKTWLKRRPKNGQVIFCVRKDSHAQAIQAFALGATALLARPVTGAAVLGKFTEDKEASESDVSSDFSADGLEGISAGLAALQNIFEATMAGGPVDVQAVAAAGDAVVSNIEEEGLARWINVVRRHHSQTFQHCLIVTGVAVGFGKHLGFRSIDKQRLAAAGILHDVGKARIPLSILEKPGPLDEAELGVMRQHPLLGLEALQSSPGLQPEMIDMVVHHHEYLDGSGYPHGLEARNISDLVRTITIADIFGALIERRSYKAPMSGIDAYAILKKMDGKLDRDLVREFRPIAER
jgi:putative nucleotidyltransferase with HDIG domain